MLEGLCNHLMRIHSPNIFYSEATMMVFAFNKRFISAKLLTSYAFWLFVSCAIITFVYFDFLVFNMPSGGARRFVNIVFDIYFFSLLILPLIIVVSIFTLNSYIAIYCQFNISIILSCLFIAMVTGRYKSHGGGGSPSDGLDALVFAFQAILIFISLLLFYISIITRVARRKGDPFYPIFYKTILAVCAGWLIGVAIWGYFYPKYVINSSEELTYYRKYCIVNGNNTVVSKLIHLMPHNMNYSRKYKYHAVMMVLSENGVEYYYWSYGRRAFVKFKYDGLFYVCKPKAHFARGLS